jgi:hypothetical protein
MPVKPPPVRHVKAHTVLLDEYDYALSLFFDGSSPADRDAALVIQCARDPRDGAAPYLEIPPQRFAAESGLQHLTIYSDHVKVSLDATAAEQLGGHDRWHIAFPKARRRELVDFARRAFARNKDLLTVESP